MSTTMVIVMLALLVTGVTTTTVFALPFASAVTGVQTPNGEEIATNLRQQLRAHDGSNDGTQTQARLRLRNQVQTCACLGEGNDALTHGDAELAAGYTYRHRVGEQSCVCAQNRNGLNWNVDPPS